VPHQYVYKRHHLHRKSEEKREQKYFIFNSLPRPEKKKKKKMGAQKYRTTVTKNINFYPSVPQKQNKTKLLSL
jgi:hypothetical protein